VSHVRAKRRYRHRVNATGSLACVVAAVGSGCGDEEVDPARLPDRVDVTALRGRALPDTACRFARDQEMVPVNPGDSAGLRVWLRCPEAPEESRIGFVQANRVLSGYEPEENSVRCVRDSRTPTLYSCGTRHGMTIVHARALCAPDQCDPEQEARKVMARIVELIATTAPD
jgi:hypothetical protein